MGVQVGEAVEEVRETGGAVVEPGPGEGVGG